MRRVRVCFVVSSPYTISSFLKNHIIELSKEYDIYVVGNFEQNNIKKLAILPVKEFKNIALHRDINLWFDFKALFSLYIYFKARRFDVVHSVTPKAGLLAMISSRLISVKTRIHIFTGQVWSNKTGLIRNILMFLDKVIIWCSTDILVDSFAQRNFLIKSGVLNQSKGIVLGKGSISGVDINKFQHDKLVRDSLRLQMNIGDDEIVFVFVGRLNRDKGVLDLVKAFNKLMIDYKSVSLMLVGHEEESIIQEIKSLTNGSHKIIFYGFTTEPAKVLMACDIFCLPSYREGFGTSVIEASSCGKPIICSDTEGLADTILDNVTGIRHQVSDVDSIYEAMKKLINDPSLREKMGVEGRKFVTSHFRAKHVTDCWIEFYKTKVN